MEICLIIQMIFLAFFARAKERVWFREAGILKKEA
jgi:hypothetical protein